jgi:hypothetical protein
VSTDEQGWPATERRTPADECQSCLTHTDDPPRLPAAEVLLDAVAVLRDLADGATPGHRSYDGTYAMAGGEPVAFIGTEGDGMLWAAFGPDEARLLADLLGAAVDAVDIDHAEPPRNPKDRALIYPALELAYTLTGHQRPGVSR